MIIAVAYKWAPDPQEASVGADGTVDFSRAKPVVSDYDAVAIEVGRQLASAAGAELVGISVGGPATAAPMATKTALARGLDRVVVVTDDGLATAGSTRTATVLAAVVGRLGDVRLVLTGDSSIDLGAQLVPTLIGGLLGWPTLTDAAKVSLADGAVTVSRILAGGAQQLRLSTPAVISVATDAATVRAPGMKDVLAAGRKPVEKLSASDLELPAVDEGTVRSAGPLTGPARRGIRIEQSDPQAAAAALIEALRTDGVLTGGVR